MKDKRAVSRLAKLLVIIIVALIVITAVSFVLTILAYTLNDGTELALGYGWIQVLGA